MDNIYRLLENISKFITEAAVRVFSPRDDEYPDMGVQPFSGEPYQAAPGFDW